MNKSEKSFYVIIENKKCGKFSGASPIQVSKKVASKKLKSGKKMEITFYLDEVGGKKKKYGPYQGRKDKKTGKFVVIKRGKIMKGGFFSSSEMDKLRNHFIIFNNNGSGWETGTPLKPFNKSTIKLSNSRFFSKTQPIIYFHPEFQEVFIQGYGIRSHYIERLFYKFAVFEDQSRNIYIMIFKKNSMTADIDIVSFTEFFLDNMYSSNFNSGNRSNKNDILISLQNLEIVESETICEEARKIHDLLYIPTSNKHTKKAMIYVPYDYYPLIKKCVYSDLTFGILDEKRVQKIDQNLLQMMVSDFNVPESFYQLFLIRKQSFFSGYDPVIFIQLPLENKEELERKKYDSRLYEVKKLPYFTYCIYADQSDGNKLKILTYFQNPISGMVSLFDTNLRIDNTLKIACSILLNIPEIFESFQRVRIIARNIIDSQQ